MFENADELTMVYSSNWDNPETKKIIEEMKNRGVIIDPKLFPLGKPDLKPQPEEVQPQTQVKAQPFLQKRKNNLLLLLVVVGGYLTYKALKK